MSAHQKVWLKVAVILALFAVGIGSGELWFNIVMGGINGLLIVSIARPWLVSHLERCQMKRLAWVFRRPFSQ